MLTSLPPPPLSLSFPLSLLPLSLIFLSPSPSSPPQGYVPTKDDVLHSRKATRGIHEYLIDIKGVPFRFVDVGGQRSQRQKWFQCFDEVTSILFLVASSAFDQTLLEDRVTNRLEESVNIFDTIVNNRCFRSVSIILFFNKTDLLVEKIKVKSIKDYFRAFEVSPSHSSQWGVVYYMYANVAAFVTLFSLVRSSFGVVCGVCV